jgi:uncharacterized protein
MVRTKAVVDTACLIGLERIGRLGLLGSLIDPVIVPEAVASEFGHLPVWIAVMPVADTGMVAALRLNLDPGESEAITLAHELSCRVILDDRKARDCAHRLGIPVTGTVGLLLRAAKYGVIPAIRPLLDDLDSCGFRISPGLREEALKLAGE